MKKKDLIRKNLKRKLGNYPRTRLMIVTFKGNTSRYMHYKERIHEYKMLLRPRRIFKSNK